MTGPRVDDEGSASVEAAIVFPVLLLLGLLLFVAVNVMTAAGQIDAAARAGARAAATGSSSADARARADAAVTSSLSQGSSCQGDVAVSMSGFKAGVPVTVTVSCTVKTVFGGAVGLGSRTATSSASELVSQVRGGLED